MPRGLENIPIQNTKKDNFEFCFPYLMKHEGGYSNHPSDPGGPTNFGITIADYRMYIDKHGTAEDVKNLSVVQAKQIFKTKYWDVLRCSELPSGVDYCIFDYGVNSGVGRPVKILKKHFNISADKMNDDLIEAISKENPSDLINFLCKERMNFLQNLKTWSVFGKGWSSRVNEVQKISLDLAKE